MTMTEIKPDLTEVAFEFRGKIPGEPDAIPFCIRAYRIGSKLDLVFTFRESIDLIPAEMVHVVAEALRRVSTMIGPEELVEPEVDDENE